MYPYDTRFFEESDGIIHSTSHHYEGGALEGWREWIKDKPIYAIGPISPPPSLEEVKAEVASNPISSEVEEFLDRAHDTHGPNSVLYVSPHSNSRIFTNHELLTNIPSVDVIWHCMVV